MNIEESFYNAWLDTKNKARAMFTSKAYFPTEIDQQKFEETLTVIFEKLEQIFDSATRPIGYVDETTVLNFFQHLQIGISELKEYILTKNKDENWLDFPISILNNLHPYLLNNFSEKLKIKSPKSHLDKLYPLGETVITWFANKNKSGGNSENEETFRQLTEANIEKMLVEFNLASVHLMDQTTWHSHFNNIQHIYKSVKQSLTRVGLPFDNLGANKKLNLVISEEFLDEQSWMGFQSKTNSSFSIFINPTPHNTCETWIHEYTHFLDRLAAYTYYQEHKNEEEISTFSHLALNHVVNQTPIRNKSLQIMAETMSATIGGVSAEEFATKMRQTINTTKEHIALKIILETLPEGDKTWNELSFTERQTLLFKSKISELTNFIMLEVSNHPHATFRLNTHDIVISVEGANITSSALFVPDIISDITERIRSLDQYIMHTKLIEYIKEDLPRDVKSIMDEHNLVIYKDHSVYDDRFFLSPGNDVMKNARQMQDNDSEVTFSYYDKPLELLARMVENLQTPLLNNFEFNKLKAETTTNFNNPILGKEERIMVCTALQSMARYVGIEVEDEDMEHLPCVLPQSIENFNVHLLDPVDYSYAQPNQIIPDETRRKLILQNIEKIKYDSAETERAFPKRKLD